MGEKIHNIAKNTSYFTFALILQKVISFSYFIILARFLPPEELGKYYFAISFTTIFAIFIDIGLANVLIREVAKEKGEANILLNSILAIKIPLALITLLVMLVLINLMNYPEITRHLVYLSAICMILDSFTLTFYSVIRGFHNLLFESIGSVVFQLITIALGFTAIKLRLPLTWFMGALICASLVNFLYSSSLALLKWKLKPSFKIDLSFIKVIIVTTIPFAIYAILQRLYTYLDSVLLSVLAGDKFVGLYQIAFKIIFALQFLPMAFIASVYPAFSNYWTKNREQLSITFERAFNYLVIISLPISFGTIILSDKIILFFKPEYIEAIWPLRLIMASLVFIFINFPIGSLLNACNRQKINTINMGITLTASLALNLFLIPRYQALGASITVVFTNLLMFILGMYWVPKIIKYKPMNIVVVFLKSLLAVIIMSALVLFLKPLLNIFVIILIAGPVYFLGLFILGGIKRADILSIIKSFKNKTAG